jgi:glycerol-3-phosphate acyltransferase PlsY
VIGLPALAWLAPIGIAFLSGSLPFGLWLGRALRGVDVRTLGSGNLGATNVYRELGPGIGIATLLLDIAKGAIPALWLPITALGADFPGGPEWCRLACGAAAVLGHVFTPFARFRGGKGVATTVGMLLALHPVACAVFLAVFVGLVAWTRFISLGSIVGSVAFAATLAVMAPGGVRSPSFAVGAVVAVLVIVRHRDNIVRLLRGEERRFSFSGGRR